MKLEVILRDLILIGVGALFTSEIWMIVYCIHADMQNRASDETDEN